MYSPLSQTPSHENNVTDGLRCHGSLQDAWVKFYGFIAMLLQQQKQMLQDASVKFYGFIAMQPQQQKQMLQDAWVKFYGFIAMQPQQQK